MNKHSETIGWVFGYVRVSANSQNEARQFEAMKDIDPSKIFIDKQSEKDHDRPELKRMINIIRRGDMMRV